MSILYKAATKRNVEQSQTHIIITITHQIAMNLGKVFATNCSSFDIFPFNDECHAFVDFETIPKHTC